MCVRCLQAAAHNAEANLNLHDGSSQVVAESAGPACQQAMSPALVESSAEAVWPALAHPAAAEAEETDHAEENVSVLVPTRARSDLLAEPSTMDSDTSDSVAESAPDTETLKIPSVQLQQEGMLPSKQEQQVAVLSLLAGAAADSAAAAQAASSHASANADVSSSGNVLDALRSDSGHSQQWQVVKTGRSRAPNASKAADRLADEAEHSHSSAAAGDSRSRDRADSSSSQAVSEASFVSGKPMRRNSSGASSTSWESALEATESSDR